MNRKKLPYYKCYARKNWETKNYMQRFIALHSMFDKADPDHKLFDRNLSKVILALEDSTNPPSSLSDKLSCLLHQLWPQ